MRRSKGNGAKSAYEHGSDIKLPKPSEPEKGPNATSESLLTPRSQRRPSSTSTKQSSPRTSSGTQDLGVSELQASGISLMQLLLGSISRLDKPCKVEGSTPKWQNRTLVGGSITLGVPSNKGGVWGVIDLDEQEWQSFFVKYDNRPQYLRIPSINPLALLEMSRLARREFLQALSKVEIDIHVQKSSGRERTRKVDFATMMIIALSIRREGPSKLIGELAGLAPAEVMTHLKEFSWLPVLEFSDIPHLAHAAARSICHRHHDHKSAGSSGGAVGDLIASILGAVDVSESRNWEQIGSQVQTIFKTFLPKDEDDGMVEIKRIMEQVSDRKGERRSKAKDTQYKSLVTEILLKQGDDKDKGAKVGLVLAGLMKYIKRSKDEIETKFKIVKLVLETILGGLTGVPVGGALLAALQAGIVGSVDLHKKRQKDVLDVLLVNLKNWYRDNIVNPVNTHGELTIKKEKVRVKTEDFEKWYGLALRYNDLSETS